MPKILSVNAGSSSLKYQLYTIKDLNVLASGQVEKIGKEDAIVTVKVNGDKYSQVLNILDHQSAVAIVLEDLLKYSEIQSLAEIKGVGHRVVHGGEFFDRSVIVDDDVLAKVEMLSKLAPLHNPPNLVGYYEFKKALPDVDHTFIFDTAFHQSMEPKAFLYALPYEYYKKYQVRRYGMHGTSHKYVTLELARLLNKDLNDLNVIVCHLGNGASLTAVKNGKVLDTSMGFTPLAGVMMGTRTGDVDPAVFPYLLEQTNLSYQELIDVYNKKSGMLGISGISNDARDISKAAAENNERAILTLDMYAYKIASYIGSYFVHLKRVDAIAFTAGIGENATDIRAQIIESIADAMEIDFDYNLNQKTFSTLTKLTTDKSKVAVYVIPTDEEIMIAKDTIELLGL